MDNKIRLVKVGICVSAIVIIVISVIMISINGITHREGDYKYRIIKDGTVEITRYTGNGDDIDIPTELGKRTVTKIGKECFQGIRDKGHVEVHIPDTIISIGQSSFAGGEGLTITGCENVEEILSNAFAKCKFENADSFPTCGKLKTIGYGAFRGTSNLGIFKLADSVEYIGAEAFGDDCVLENIPENVEYIGKNGISLGYECAEDEEVIVGDGILVNIPVNETIIVPEGVKMVSTVINDDNYNGGSVKLYIPDTVSTIEAGLFAYEFYKSVTIYIPSSVTYIGAGPDATENDNMIVYNMDKSNLVVEEGSYAEGYAKKNNIPYKTVESVSETYRQAVIEHNRKFLEESNYDIELSGEDGMEYKLVKGTDNDGTGYEKIIGINPDTDIKTEITKVTQDYYNGGTVSKIIGYESGIVYYIDSNFKIYSSPVGGSERTELATIYNSYNATFRLTTGTLTITYYIENMANNGGIEKQLIPIL